MAVAVSRQEYWNGLPFPSPGDFPDPEIEPGSPALKADTLTFEPPMLHKKRGGEGHSQCFEFKSTGIRGSVQQMVTETGGLAATELPGGAGKEAVSISWYLTRCLHEYL